MKKAALIALALIAPSVHGDNFRSDFEECSEVASDTDRLTCFDQALASRKEQEKKDLQTPKIIQRFSDAGIKLSSIRPLQRPLNSPRPESYDENWEFKDDELSNGKGGQIFLCSKKRYCDAIFSYYDGLKMLAGPYLYRNSDGTIVAQLNSGHPPKSAERYENVLNDN